MRWAVLAIFVLALVPLGAAVYTQRTGRSGDERAGSAILYLIGGALLVLDAVIVLVYGVLALFR
ncbi:MAG TPA: hypothetical protein VF601_18675 [Beijerinckiaceae bacterium]|jgi:hypothetical protein